MSVLWASGGCFEVVLRHFQKTFIFPMDFNDFLISGGQLGAMLGVTWGLLWATFGSLWGYFGHLRVALGDVWVTLGSLWRYDAYMCGVLEGPFWI